MILNLSKFDNIDIKPTGVWSSAKTLYFKSRKCETSEISDQGDIPIKVIALDDDIKQSVTFIKMDIDGAESDAIIGARNHIINDKPKLAICVYHKNNDIWKITNQIYEINSTYKFYLSTIVLTGEKQYCMRFN